MPLATFRRNDRLGEIVIDSPPLNLFSGELLADQRARALNPFDFVERGAQAGDHLSVDPVEWWGADRQERKRAA